MSYVARRAVDDELLDEALNREETMAFLSDDDVQDAEEMMAESPFRTYPSSRPTLPPLPMGVEDRFVNGGS